jgi:threonine synthase
VVDHLACTRCDQTVSADELRNTCDCGGPLMARYDLAAIAARVTHPGAGLERADVWRYRELMPIEADETPLTLGEGWTPLVRSQRIGPALGLERLYFKDEGLNPTGTFKARGMAVAVHRARALGARGVILPSAGNAGSAAAAYCAAAGLTCTVAMPESTPQPIIDECRAFGADLQLVAGSIADAGQWVRQRIAEDGSFDLSTLREPYRIEGKKTMGYELAEAFGWRLPNAILYPTGGGTGLIAMWKAFDELETLGWIGPERPRMIAVQATGCAPIVTAFRAGADTAPPATDPETVASGLRVPSALGDFLILAALRSSGGTAVAVTDPELLDGAHRLASLEGISAGPEAGATVAALLELLETGAIERHERVVCFVTGHGLKYPAVMSAA